MEISQIATSLQDSLQSVYCNDKIKGVNKNDLKKALDANRDFMNKLGPALAECQNTQFTPWTEQPCKGPCGDFEVYTVSPECAQLLKDALGVSSENCVINEKMPDLSNRKIGDKVTLKGSKPNIRGLFIECKTDFYFFDGPVGAKGWYKLSEFEKLIKPYLVELYTILEGDNIIANKGILASQISHSYYELSKWEDKTFSPKFSDIPFRESFINDVKKTIFLEKAGTGTVTSFNIDFDILLIFSKPLFTLGKSVAVLAKAAYLVPVKGAKTGLLYYMLNTGTKKAIAKASERGVLMELEYLSGKQATYETLLELPNVKYINPAGKESSGVLRYVKDGNKYGWVEGEIAVDIWKLSLQTLGKPASGTTLGSNLVKIGKIRPSNSAAHHIVAGGSTNVNANNARKVLSKLGVDINEAANGVFLPKSSKYVIDDAVAHSKVHTNLYYETIFNRIKNVSKEDIRDELSTIADELLKGTFPY